MQQSSTCRKEDGTLKLNDEETFNWTMKIGCFWINLISSEYNPAITDMNFNITARSVENQFYTLCKRIEKDISTKNHMMISPLIACMIRSSLMTRCNVEKIIQSTINIDCTSMVEDDIIENLENSGDDYDNEDDDDNNDDDDDDDDDQGNDEREKALSIYEGNEKENKGEGTLSDLEAMESWVATKNENEKREGDKVDTIHNSDDTGKRKRNDHHTSGFDNCSDDDIDDDSDNDEDDIDLEEEEMKLLDPHLQQAPTIWKDDKGQEWPLGLVPGSSILGSLQNPSLIFSLY